MNRKKSNNNHKSTAQLRSSKNNILKRLSSQHTVDKQTKTKQCSHMYGNPQSRCKLQVMYNKDDNEVVVSKYCWVHTTLRQINNIRKHHNSSSKHQKRPRYKRTKRTIKV